MALTTDIIPGTLGGPQPYKSANTIEGLRRRLIAIDQERDAILTELSKPETPKHRVETLKDQVRVLELEEYEAQVQLKFLEREQKEQRTQEAEVRAQQQFTASTRGQTSQATPRPAINAAQLKGAAEKFKESLNSRTTKPPTSPDEAISTLRGVKKPFFEVYLILAAFAALIDLLGFVKPVADAAIAGIVIGILVELYLFLVVRAVMNRGRIMSWAILASISFSGIVQIIPIIGQLIGGGAFLILILLAITNRNVRAVEASQNELTSHIAGLEQKVTLARQGAARLIRAGRRSPALAKTTRAVVRSRTFKSLATSSKAMRRFLGFSLAEMIPIVGMIPFNTAGIYLTYRDQKRIYRESQELIAEYESMRGELEGLDSALVAEQTSQFMARAQQLQSSRMGRTQKTQLQEASPANRGQSMNDVVSGTPQPQARAATPRGGATTPTPMRDIAVAAPSPA